MVLHVTLAHEAFDRHVCAPSLSPDASAVSARQGRLLKQGIDEHTLLANPSL